MKSAELDRISDYKKIHIVTTCEVTHPCTNHSAQHQTSLTSFGCMCCPLMLVITPLLHNALKFCLSFKHNALPFPAYISHTQNHDALNHDAKFQHMIAWIRVFADIIKYLEQFVHETYPNVLCWPPFCGSMSLTIHDTLELKHLV